ESSAEKRFGAFYRHGHALATDSPDTVSAMLQTFELGNPAQTGWMESIAFCRGVLAPQVDEDVIAVDLETLHRFAESCERLRNSHATSGAGAIDIERLKHYFTALKLKQFVVLGPSEAEYRLAGPASNAQFEKT